MITALNVEKEVIPRYFQNEVYPNKDAERARSEMAAWFSKEINNAIITNYD